MKLVRALALLGLLTPLSAQYAGPAILTRGQAPASMATPQIDFRPFLEVAGIYDTGLSGVAITPEGQLPKDKSYGVEANAGISGLHTWRHTTLGLDLRGAIRHYSQRTFYDGTDESLMISLTHQLSRHKTLVLRESAGLFSRNFSFPTLPQAVTFDPSTAFIPSSDFFDNRTIYASSQADFIYQKSARLSFSFGGQGFLQRRRSSALYGVTGGGASSDVQYRLTRRTTVGANYTYSHYAFRGLFGGTDLHGVAGTYAIRVSRTVEFSGYAGAFRAETKFIRSVPVDPAITALFGITQGVQVSYNVNYVPNLGARLSRTFHRGVIYISAEHSVTPGNGLFLTSTMTAITSAYTYTGLRRWSFTAAAFYSDAATIGNTNGGYGNYSGTLSLSRSVGRGAHVLLSGIVRQYTSGDFSNYNRLIYSVRLGMGWSPGDIPLRLW